MATSSVQHACLLERQAGGQATQPAPDNNHGLVQRHDVSLHTAVKSSDNGPLPNVHLDCRVMSSNLPQGRWVRKRPTGSSHAVASGVSAE